MRKSQIEKRFVTLFFLWALSLAGVMLIVISLFKLITAYMSGMVVPWKVGIINISIGFLLLTLGSVLERKQSTIKKQLTTVLGWLAWGLLLLVVLLAVRYILAMI